MTIPLFKRFPDARRTVPHTELCCLPTPVQRLDPLGEELGVGSLFVKRDDASAHGFGGNKTRKLEFVLADCVQRGAAEVLTFGFAGSNFATACAYHAHNLGLDTISMLLTQENAAYLRRNLLFSHSYGADCHQRNGVPGLAFAAVLESAKRWVRGRKVCWIPAGGSSPAGVLGFVNAGLELGQQVEAGLLDEPDWIYLPVGSMGSAAGLALGLQVAGLATRIAGVRVVEKAYANPWKLKKLLTETVAFGRRHGMDLGDFQSALEQISMRDEFIGDGYAHPTPQAVEAAQLCKERVGIRLDSTYSAKAMAALMADARAGKLTHSSVVFWSTFDSVSEDDRIREEDWRMLPKTLQSYFQTAQD